MGRDAAAHEPASESITQQEGSQAGVSPKGFLTGESLSLLPPERCPELPSVDNSIFVVEEMEGQILGTYTCMNGYHLVGEKNLFCSASEGWNAPTPKCHCKLDLSASSPLLSSPCVLSHSASRSSR